MNYFLDRLIRRKINQRVSMVRVKVVDLHVDALSYEYSDRFAEARGAARLSNIGSRRSVSQIR